MNHIFFRNDACRPAATSGLSYWHTVESNMCNPFEDRAPADEIY